MPGAFALSRQNSPRTRPVKCAPCRHPTIHSRHPVLLRFLLPLLYTFHSLSLSPPFSPFLIYSSLAGESPANGQTAGMRTSSIRRLSSRPPFARILLYPLTELTGRNGVPAARARIHARTYHIRSCTHARICADRSARTAHILHMNAVPALRAQYITARDVSCNLRTIMQMRPERAHVRW